MGPPILTLNSLPPLQDLLHPTPETYSQILTLWQYFAGVSLPPKQMNKAHPTNPHNPVHNSPMAYHLVSNG